MEHISKIKIKITKKCPQCNGEGAIADNESKYIEEYTCDYCSGTGEVEELITLKEFAKMQIELLKSLKLK